MSVASSGGFGGQEESEITHVDESAVSGFGGDYDYEYYDYEEEEVRIEMLLKSVKTVRLFKTATLCLKDFAKTFNTIKTFITLKYLKNDFSA